MTKLYAPDTYWNETPAVLAAVAGGCGPGGKGDWLVPDTIWFLSVREACRIHDYMYWRGKTLEDKKEADRVFLNNMLRIIDEKSSWWGIRKLRRHRAKLYYLAVKNFGGPSFWDGKNSNSEFRRTKNEKVSADVSRSSSRLRRGGMHRGGDR